MPPEAGDLFAALRGELNLSQEELAALADVSPWTISNIERGRHRPQAETLRKIVRALDPTPVRRRQLAAALQLDPRAFLREAS